MHPKTNKKESTKKRAKMKLTQPLTAQNTICGNTAKNISGIVAILSDSKRHKIQRSKL